MEWLRRNFGINTIDVQEYVNEFQEILTISEELSSKGKLYMNNEVYIGLTRVSRNKMNGECELNEYSNSCHNAKIEFMEKLVELKRIIACSKNF